MNIYQSLYDLVNTYVYGNTIVAGSVADLVATLIGTCGCLFLVSLPFLLVWRIARMIGG